MPPPSPPKLPSPPKTFQENFSPLLSHRILYYILFISYWIHLKRLYKIISPFFVLLNRRFSIRCPFLYRMCSCFSFFFFPWFHYFSLLILSMFRERNRVHSTHLTSFLFLSSLFSSSQPWLPSFFLQNTSICKFLNSFRLEKIRYKVGIESKK